MTAGLPDDIASFVQRHVGGPTSVTFCGWDHGVSDVWDCRTADGQRVFVKRCRDKYDQEVHAYRAWTPHLLGRCPELIAAHDDLRTLIVTAVDGVLAQDAELDADGELDVYRQAGRFLADLHALEIDGDVDHVAVFVDRAERWVQRATDIVDAADRAWVMARITETVPTLHAIRRGPCHRDYTPRNWVIDTDATVRVIDFGHTRVDYWILDVDKLWSDQWIDRPAREAAFWDGYGTRPTHEESNVLEAVSALGALSTIVWSREHDDIRYEAHGRAHLARLRARHR